MTTDKFDHGPLQTWEVTWRDGRVERVRGHQCLWPSDLFTWDREQSILKIHGEIDGKWLLVLAVDAKEILSVRHVAEVNHAPKSTYDMWMDTRAAGA